MNGLFQQLLDIRGINADFLHPKYDQPAITTTLPDIDRAVARIKQAVNRGERVLIYGDYDVDGVTASVVMHDALELAHIQEVKVMLPNRFVDGYGMSKKVVDEAKQGDFPLVITVDCGSRNHDIIAELRAAGIDVIVTDHHECGETLPDAIAVLNPKRNDVELPLELRHLAGVGVAFKFAEALTQTGLIPSGQEKWLLDLVLIGTICDSMPMSLENRRLCYYGLKVLKKTRRPGLKELLRLINAREIRGDTIGFQIGPRLNAAGRLDTAEKSLDLLMATTRPVAAKLAAELESYNKERRAKQDQALAEIKERGVGDNPVIIERGEWHEGILGIVAGRLTEEYHRPAFAFTALGQRLKGSGRSFGDFNLAQALKACENLLLSGGGHAEACGVTIDDGNFEEFCQQMNDYYRGLNLQNQERYLALAADLTISNFRDLSLELIEQLHELEPFGEGNAEPIFLLKDARIVEANCLGENREHLRLIVWDQNGESLKLMWFYAPERYRRIQAGETANIWVTLSENEFRGIRSVEGRILKIAA